MYGSCIVVISSGVQAVVAAGLRWSIVSPQTFLSSGVTKGLPLVPETQLKSLRATCWQQRQAWLSQSVYILAKAAVASQKPTLTQVLSASPMT